MKRPVKICMNACIISALMASSAYAAPRSDWYVGLNGDVTWLNHSDTGTGGNVRLGYRFWPTDFGNFRIEAEGGYHGAGGDDGFPSTRYFSYLGNLYYDFNTLFPQSSSSEWRIIPYIGGGLGGAAVRQGSGDFGDTLDDHDSRFAYQGMAGLSFASNSMPNTEWSLGYRYLGTGDKNISANNVELGLRFYF